MAEHLGDLLDQGAGLVWRHRAAEHDEALALGALERGLALRRFHLLAVLLLAVLNHLVLR